MVVLLSELVGETREIVVIVLKVEVGSSIEEKKELVVIISDVVTTVLLVLCVEVELLVNEIELSRTVDD